MTASIRFVLLALGFIILIPNAFSQEPGKPPAAMPNGAPASLNAPVKLTYEPYELPKFVDDLIYPGAEPPKGTVSRHGEIEYIGQGVFATHWFVEAEGAVWHLATAGDPENEPIVFVHGYPETWYAFHELMAGLADDYYVIAVDTLGNGQSDKNLELDFSYAAVAVSLKALLDEIDIDSFNLVGHDRGAIIGDNLLTLRGMNKRMKTYVRMQQSADQPHGYPRPPHKKMANPEWQSRPGLVRQVYTSKYVSIDLPESVLARAEWEFGFEGSAEAVARTFESAGFDKELEFRQEKVFPMMTMPVLFLQGEQDPGQRPEEYYRTADVVEDGEVRFVPANHFLHLEVPELIVDIIREFISTKG